MDPSRQLWLLSKPVGRTSEASALGQNMTVNLSASMSTFATLPVLPTAPQPTIQLFWEAPEPLLTEGISPWNPLVLSALPGMSLAAEAGSTTLDIAVPLNIVQVGTPGRPVQPMPHANIVLTEESLNFNVPVTQGGGMGCPASLFITATAANTFINDQIASDVQPQEGLWVLESHPPTTQPVVQLVPVRSPVNSAPPPIGAFGESCPANVQTNSPENCLTNPDSVYGNIRHCQYIKTLVQQHLSQTPDVSAFSCFFISLIYSINHICGHITSKSFFVALGKDKKGLKEESHETCNSMKTGPHTDPACLPVLRHTQLRKTEATMEIPPEDVHEYMDIIDWLERLPQSYTGEPTEKEEKENSGPEKEGDDFYSDAGVLSYIDELCSQKHFFEKLSCVEDIINPKFVAEILSSKPEMDILSLMKELEYEEELSVEQHLEEHWPGLKKKCYKRAPLNTGAPQILSNSSVPTVCQGTKEDDHGPQRGDSTQKVSSPVLSLDHQCPGATNEEIWGPRPIDFQSSQCLASLGDVGSTAISYGRRAHPQSPGSRSAMSLRGISAMEEFQESLGRTMEEKEELPSLSFLLWSHYRLVPWKLSGPYTGLSDSASIPKPISKIKYLSPDPSATDMTNKRALIGGLTPMDKKSKSGLCHGMFEGPLSALDITQPLQAQKKKLESLGPWKR
ncbi:LOW QUALITY PROTEIN: NUT family member 2 isoform X1 [Cricetulus griseus]|uniref:LOW QUALITY PROTEIN: NUT family member 2 isoform X1 n=1 Tax=Cricetulus griseus TaxID=10029 RepID=UPI000454AEAE|nr:LOW QUALITY PROTEIN: NUT family member 2 isoform X1 [Cricetulus griseus]